MGHIELEQDMTGGKRHLIQFTHVPCTDDVPPGIGIILNGIHHSRYLVNSVPVGRGPASPLVTVDMTKIAIFVGPLVPNPHPVVVEVFDIGISL